MVSLCKDLKLKLSTTCFTVPLRPFKFIFLPIASLGVQPIAFAASVLIIKLFSGAMVSRALKMSVSDREEPAIDLMLNTDTKSFSIGIAVTSIEKSGACPSTSLIV
ncbi:hypothetical protein D3C78_1704060 [compost metagenome]